MSDQPTPQGFPVTDPRKEPVKFITHILVSGYLNGVINLTLGTAQFSTANGLDVLDDVVVATRLRMDLYTAQRLHDLLGAMIEKNTRALAAATPANETRN